MEARAVVVTGVSSGIGKGIAEVLVQRGVRVFGSVRNATDADRLSSELGELFEPLIFDITDGQAVRAGAERVAQQLGRQTLMGLVNNAGVGATGPLATIDPEAVLKVLDVNVVGALRVTQAFAPLLGLDRSRKGAPGRVVMISSVAGKFAAPFLGAYVASKHALEGLSDSLRRELKLFGIDVVVVGPGAVRTLIFEKAKREDFSALKGTEWEKPLRAFMDRFFGDAQAHGLPTQAVGEMVWEALSVKRPKLRYVAVARFVQDWLLPLSLPARFIDAGMAKEFGLKNVNQSRERSGMDDPGQ